MLWRPGHKFLRGACGGWAWWVHCLQSDQGHHYGCDIIAFGARRLSCLPGITDICLCWGVLNEVSHLPCHLTKAHVAADIVWKGEPCLVTCRNVPKRVVHRPRAVLRRVHPSSTGHELQNFLVAFARVWHISKRKDFPQQHSKGPVHRTREMDVDAHIPTCAHTWTHTYTHIDTQTQM